MVFLGAESLVPDPVGSVYTEARVCSAVLPTVPQAHADSGFCVTDTPPLLPAAHSAGALPRAHQACLAFLGYRIVEEGFSVPKSYPNTALVTGG